MSMLYNKLNIPTSPVTGQPVTIRHPKCMLDTKIARLSLERRFVLALPLAFAIASSSKALPLAPLGSKTAASVGPKTRGLSTQDVADLLALNLTEGQYFITGDLRQEIFDDNCRFIDPTNDIVGLSRYMKALTLLFDASHSAVKLQDIKVTGEKEIMAHWVLGGYLKFPWHPRVAPFQGKTVYTLGKDGLIINQDQTWSISSFEALRESFTPEFEQPGNDVIEEMNKIKSN